MAVHCRVVDELPEDRDGRFHGCLMGGPERVAHAEAHAVVFCEMDVHSGWFVDVWLCWAQLKVKKTQ
jgi:hypothetical protein